MLSVSRARVGVGDVGADPEVLAVPGDDGLAVRKVEVGGLGVIIELPADAAASGIGRVQPCAVEVQI